MPINLSKLTGNLSSLKVGASQYNNILPTKVGSKKYGYFHFQQLDNYTDLCPVRLNPESKL